MEQVQVTNGNTFALRGRFDGQDYYFPAGKPTEVPAPAADHIFGLRQQDKTRALNCLGILKAGVSYEEALKALAKIRFAEGRMVYEAQQHEPGKHHPGHPPGQQQPGQPGQTPGQQPGQPQKGPGQGEDDDEESGESPGAPRSPGRKSEAGAIQAISPASGDLPTTRRQW